MCAWIRACGGSVDTSTKYLYQNGVQKADWSTDFALDTRYYSESGTVTFGASSVTITPTKTLEIKSIDLIKYSKLCVKGTVNGTAYNKTIDVSSVTTSVVVAFGIFVYGGKYYARLYVSTNPTAIDSSGGFTDLGNSYYTSSITVTVTEVWLEK